MGKKKSKDDDLDDLLAATAAPTGFMGWLLSIWAAILAIFLGAPAPAQIPAKKAKAKKAAPAPLAAREAAAAAPAPAPAKAKKTKAKKAKKQEVKKPVDDPMPTLGGSSNWADDDGDDGWATAGSKPVASKKGKKTQEVDPDEGFATVTSKKDKKKGGSASAPAPAPVEDDWAPAAKKGKASKKQEHIEPSGPVTLNNKAKKLKKRLIIFYEKHNKQKAKEFIAGKNDDLCAHFCKAGNSLEMLNEKLLDLYSQDLESIA